MKGEEGGREGRREGKRKEEENMREIEDRWKTKRKKMEMYHTEKFLLHGKVKTLPSTPRGPPWALTKCCLLLLFCVSCISQIHHLLLHRTWVLCLHLVDAKKILVD